MCIQNVVQWKYDIAENVNIPVKYLNIAKYSRSAWVNILSYIPLLPVTQTISLKTIRYRYFSVVFFSEKSIFLEFLICRSRDNECFHKDVRKRGICTRPGNPRFCLRVRSVVSRYSGGHCLIGIMATFLAMAGTGNNTRSISERFSWPGRA